MNIVQKKLKKGLTVALSGLLLCGSLSLTAYADEPYDVYNYDRWGEAIPSQAGYLAQRAVSGEDLGTTHFNNASDIFRDHNDRFYVADTGNNRIVVVNTDWTETVKVLDTFTMPDGSTTTLMSPKGVYVSPQNELIYIADSENSRVLACDLDGNVKICLEKPASEVYDQQSTFLPQKVLVDKAENVYIVLNNTTNGACVFNAAGEFTGFYGPNRVEPTAEVLARYFWRTIATEEMQEKMKKSVASAFSNFDLDDEGFIYTSTESATQVMDRVKKVNPAGENLFADYNVKWGDRITTWYSGTSYVTRIVDIDVADDGSINCLDSTTGRVFQYDKECNLLFIVGTQANQVGGFSRVTAVETIGTSILVLDGDKNTVTIYDETAFGETVHYATELYNEGRYEEALEPWYEVLKYDGNYRRAFIGIASALFNKGDYEGSMKYAKLADSPYIYNRAFEGWRTDFLKENLTLILVAVAGVAGGIAAVYFVLKKKNGNNGKEGKQS